MRLWEDKIRQVEPYTPGEQPKGTNLIKLNTNENPYPPSPLVKKALEEMDPAQFRKYPDPSSGVLVQALSEAYGMEPERFFVGVGSDDVLGMAFLTFFNSDRPVLFPSITYSFYPVWADLFRIPWEAVPVAEDMSIRAKDYEKENGGIIFQIPMLRPVFSCLWTRWRKLSGPMRM